MPSYSDGGGYDGGSQAAVVADTVARAERLPAASKASTPSV